MAKQIYPDYVYTTIPAEWVCIHRKILMMMADYGEAMLKDCKASCTDRSSNTIECFNMFNAAVAAKNIGQDKKANLIINYIKAKINQIYKGVDTSEFLTTCIDKRGTLQTLVKCKDVPEFWMYDEGLESAVFIVGSGKDFDDVYKSYYARAYDGDPKGSYNLTVAEGDRIIIVILTTEASKIEQIEMNNVNIPMNVTTYEAYTVYTSINTYQAGEYVININY